MATASLSTITLGDFVKYLVALLDEKEVQMPLRDEQPWHRLFYDLQTANSSNDNLPFLRSMEFDWDGPYPKCRELARFLHALHWNASVAALNPKYATIQLDKEVARVWNEEREHLDPHTRDALGQALQDATNKFAV